MRENSLSFLSSRGCDSDSFRPALQMFTDKEHLIPLAKVGALFGHSLRSPLALPYGVPLADTRPRNGQRDLGASKKCRASGPLRRHHGFRSSAPSSASSGQDFTAFGSFVCARFSTDQPVCCKRSREDCDRSISATGIYSQFCSKVYIN